MVNKFNLIEESWIPIAGAEPASLRAIFSSNGRSQLGGTPVQKLSILKLLLAIAQRVETPLNEAEWKALGPKRLGEKCLSYLETNSSLFYLYGDRPFLQFPILKDTKTHKGTQIPVMLIGQPYHPDIPADNDTIINQLQVNRVPTEAEEALFIISIMNYSPGGKRVAYMPPLTPHFTNKGKSAKPGPSLGNYHGYLQNCLWGRSILETVWLNLFTKKDLSMYPQWEDDELIPPWELMPKGEDDEVARRLKQSYMGTLVGLCRFTLLTDKGILFTEGIQYPNHKEGWREPFMSFRKGGRVQFLDTSKMPWRNLDALLSLALADTDKGYVCPQIQHFLLRSRNAVSSFGIWSGGLQVRGTAGDQSVKQSDDFIESLVFLDSKVLGEGWFRVLETQMEWLEKTGFSLRMSVRRYYEELKENKAPIYDVAVARYWEYCETLFQDLIDACEGSEESRQSIRFQIAKETRALYDRFCGRDSSRQMIAWVKNQPVIHWNIKREE